MGAASWEREPTQSDGTLEENWLFRLRRERHRSRRTGKGHDFYVLELADAVSVVALTPDRKLVLVRQFRAGSKEDSLETPGGLLEAGEDPCVAGARELAEETGYAGDPPVLLGTVWSNPSLMTSRIATILITNARPSTQPRPDEGEEVAVELVPAAEIPRMIADGRIDHALVVAGLLWWLVAEMPGTPLATERRTGSRWPRFRIATGMAIIATIALVLGVARYVAEKDPSAMLAGVVLLVTGSIGSVVFFKLSVRQNSVLINLVEKAHRWRNETLWYLAMIGLVGLIWLLSMLLLAPSFFL